VIVPDSGSVPPIPDPVPVVSEEIVVESNDAGDEESESEDTPIQLVNLARPLVPIVNLTEESRFENVGEVEDLLALITDSNTAQAVLKLIVANVTSDDVDNLAEEELRRLRLGSNATAVFNPAYLWDQFDEISEKSGLSDLHLTIGAITGFGALGYVLWALRGGALMALALSQLPSWRMIDPLPVLESYAVKTGEQPDELDPFFD
jgi:hypothetical protein